MPYKEDPNFYPPPINATLWRYIDFAKLVSMLDSSSLFFVRVDKLGDPFEGTLPSFNLEMQPALYPQIPSDMWPDIRTVFLSLRRFCAVNCWHWNDYESAAMWALYGREQSGIAIKTSFASLAVSFKDPTNIYIGKVTYVDYDKDFIPEGSSFSAYLYKRKSFEHEQEVRAMITQVPPFDSIDTFLESPDPWENGRSCTVDLHHLIHEVIVSPLAPDWLFELVQTVVTKYGLSVPVRRSRIAETP